MWKHLIAATALLVAVSTAAAPTAELTSQLPLSVEGGSHLIPLPDQRFYLAPARPAWQRDQLHAITRQQQHSPLLLQIDSQQIPAAVTRHDISINETCPATPTIESASQQQTIALSDGSLLASGGFCTSSNTPVVTVYWWNQDWQKAGALKQGRVWHTVTRLPDDSVLFSGGVLPTIQQDQPKRVLASVELWRQGKVLSVPDLPAPRLLHSATRLPDGQILVAGGLDAELKPVRDTWLWREGEATWRAGPLLPQASFDHAALQTTFGLMLVGGRNAEDRPLLQTLLLKSPAEGFVELAPTPVPTAGATLAQNIHGELLLSGGVAGPTNQINNMLLRFDGQQWQTLLHQQSSRMASDWSVQASGDGHWWLATPEHFYRLDLNTDTTPALSPHSHYPRADWSGGTPGASIVQLPDGKLLVVGGASSQSPAASTFSELFDPSTGLWQQLPAPQAAHLLSQGILLQDGRVVLVGGLVDRSGTGLERTETRVELFDPASQQWQWIDGLNFATSERVKARRLKDGSLLFIASNEYREDSYVSMRAVRWNPQTGQLQQFQAPDVTRSSDGVAAPAQQLPVNAEWLITNDGNVALLGGEERSYDTAPDCVAQFAKASANRELSTEEIEAICPEALNTYGWHTVSRDTSQQLTWHLAEQRLSQSPIAADLPYLLHQAREYADIHNLQFANGDVLLKGTKRNAAGKTSPRLVRWSASTGQLHDLPDHPNDWDDNSRLYAMIPSFALDDGGLVINNHWLPANATAWVALPETPTGPQFYLHTDSLLAVNWQSGWIGKWSAGTQWQPMSHGLLTSQGESRLLSLRNGDILRVSHFGYGNVLVQRWQASSNSWRTESLPLRQVLDLPQVVQLANDQLLLLAKTYRNQLQCLVFDTQWQSCAGITLEYEATPTLATLDDGRAALMTDPLTAYVFDQDQRSWQTYVPYQQTQQQINGVAVTLAQPLLKLANKSSNEVVNADALGALYSRNNLENFPVMQWDAKHQNWAYIFENWTMGPDAIQLADDCWLSVDQQHAKIFNPATGKVTTQPERFNFSNAAIARGPGQTVLLMAEHAWQYDLVDMWYQASCQGLVRIENPLAQAQTPVAMSEPAPEPAPQQVSAPTTDMPSIGPWWQPFAIWSKPLLYPSLLLVPGIAWLRRRQLARDEAATGSTIALVLAATVLLLALLGHRLAPTIDSSVSTNPLTSTGRSLGPQAELCLNQLQNQWRQQADATKWHEQLATCLQLTPSPRLDCRLAGRWSQHNSLASNTSYLTTFAANGRYTVVDSAGGSSREYRGLWAVWDDKLIWFAEDSLDPLNDVNPIVSMTEDTIVLRENNGSTTTLRRQAVDPQLSCSP